MKKNENNDLISVIVPIYNSSDYLIKSISSILSQTYKNIEIILIDDCSKDNSLDICKKITKNDARVQLLKNDCQKGAAYSRNLGIKLSKGKYVCFVDSDDEVNENYVEYLYNLLIKNSADMSIGCYLVKSDKKEIFFKNNNLKKVMVPEECLEKVLCSNGISVSLCAKLFSRKALNNIIFPEGYMYEDDAKIYNIIMNCDRIAYGSECIYTYYKRKNSVMTLGFSDKRLILLKYAEDIKKDILSKYPKLQKYVEKKIIDYHFSILRQMCFSKLNDSQENEKQKIVKFLKEKKDIILSSNLYDKKEKIAIISLSLGIEVYKISWKMYELINY